MKSSKLSFLIIEDSPVTVAQIMNIAAEITDDIAISRSGERGLSIFESALSTGNSFDILIVDMNLPGMNGKELMEKCRDFEQNFMGCQAKIIAMSADPPKSHLSGAVAAGAGCYLKKPITKEKLLSALTKLGFILEGTETPSPAPKIDTPVNEQPAQSHIGATKYATPAPPQKPAEQVAAKPVEQEVSKACAEKLFCSCNMHEKICLAKQSMGEECYEEFKDELFDILNSAEAKLLKLEEDKHNSELVAGIFRDFHTTKGNCGMMGLDGVSAFTHRLEDVFSKIRSGELEVKSDIIDIALKGQDLICSILEGNKGEELDEIQVKVLTAIEAHV